MAGESRRLSTPGVNVPVVVALTVFQLLATCQVVSPFLFPKRLSSSSSLTYQNIEARLQFKKRSKPKWNQEEMAETDYVVCGGGPAGLLSAIMLAQTFPKDKVKLYDRLQPPPAPTDDAWSDVARFYLIGLGSRGQSALEKFGLLEEVTKYGVFCVGRKDWAPDAEEGTIRIFEERKVQTLVLPRDKLVGILHQHIFDNYPDRIELNYGFEIEPLSFGDGIDQAQSRIMTLERRIAQLEAQLATKLPSRTIVPPAPSFIGRLDNIIVRASQCSPTAGSDLTSSEAKTALAEAQEVLSHTDKSMVVSSKLLIAADGNVRTIANAIQRRDEKRYKEMNLIKRLFAGPPFKVRGFIDDNRRIYKTIPLKIPDDWPKRLNYSARSKGSRIVFDALPANLNGDYCGVILLRETDSLAKEDSDPAELRKVLDAVLPDFSALIDDSVLATVAKKPPSYLPAFRYIGPRLHEGDKTLLLGDCAHTLKPYFGLGANSALEDVKVLKESIDKTRSLGEAIKLFSKVRAGEAKKLVTISRELDRPGALGFVTFVLPIILDAIFHKSFPNFFSPNTITMLQRDDLTFRQVARKKRRDRYWQIFILWVAIRGMWSGTQFLILSLSRALHRQVLTTIVGLVGVSFGLAILRLLLPFMVPGLAPADVMNKT